mmetsp:Transcript_14832/g.42199  ORF Transcript_14832/g.42199 Transcript_14832/m.42199 type:complete len:296 (-) Transcript_14832:188-1075(-)
MIIDTTLSGTFPLSFSCRLSGSEHLATVSRTHVDERPCAAEGTFSSPSVDTRRITTSVPVSLTILPCKASSGTLSSPRSYTASASSDWVSPLLRRSSSPLDRSTLSIGPPASTCESRRVIAPSSEEHSWRTSTESRGVRPNTTASTQRVFRPSSSASPHGSPRSSKYSLLARAHSHVSFPMARRMRASGNWPRSSQCSRMNSPSFAMPTPSCPLRNSFEYTLRSWSSRTPNGIECGMAGGGFSGCADGMHTRTRSHRSSMERIMYSCPACRGSKLPRYTPRDFTSARASSVSRAL